eukprot:TRINITY_DN9898_c0_g1_i1.p1 TRINITY_DN9898_c0_g1~~TRINITY_DN9898_c0_g1_i1.p1  ORF type:complete len:280 (-),score=64.40 TRINITY_DN9898_c0_g1_i1:74-913(-)
MKHYDAMLKPDSQLMQNLPQFDEEKFITQRSELRAKERSLREKLNAMETRRKIAASNIDKLTEQKHENDQLGEKLWKEVDTTQVEFLLNMNQIHSCRKELTEVEQELEACGVSLFGQVFEISHDGHFATINGFRLGKLPTISVTPQEINSAFGCVAHMLEVIALKINFEFRHSKPIPYGSFSKMRQLPMRPSDVAREFDLYLHSRSSIKDQFDLAIVCLLASFRELEARFGDPLKYKVSVREATVGGVNVKLTGNNDEQWTQGLKYLAINLKLLSRMAA